MTLEKIKVIYCPHRAKRHRAKLPDEPKKRGRFPRLNRSFFGIGLASFLSDIGHEMATASYAGAAGFVR